jgi:hypothetical protein
LMFLARFANLSVDSDSGNDSSAARAQQGAPVRRPQHTRRSPAA